MKIAVLEDDEPQSQLVAKALRDAGHTALEFASGRTLLTKLRQDAFDLLILDWSVPHASGLEVTTWVRKNLQPSPPILMVTARSASEDVVAALNAGADDFIVKPVEPLVLMARVNALLRRAYPPERTTEAPTLEGFAFDPLTLSVSWDGGKAQLTAKEFALALLLFRNLHRTLGRAYLLDTVWGRNPDLPTRTLDAHISKVRTKLGLRPEAGYRLAPVYSYGYRLERLLEAEAAETP